MPLREREKIQEVLRQVRMPFTLKTFKVGQRCKRGEGLRIGTVRYLPRGVKKEDYKAQNYFDLWLPLLAPSAGAIKGFKDSKDKEKAWKRFKDVYTREMTKGTDARQSILLLAEASKKMEISIGCYCEDELTCHRSLLAELIRRARSGL